MKQVININFQGRVVPIEQTAYDTLKNYIDSLNRFFSNEEGKEEIINDIENRISELFQQRLKDGATCITDDDVAAIMKSMGRPEDFDAQDGNTSSANTASSSTATTEEAPYNAANFTMGGHKKLFRDENDKILGGVCSGLANYFGIDTVVVRVIFVLLIISFGFGLIPYIILWVVVPSTATTQIGSFRKRLFRDVENKYIAGVASGLGNYFGISAWIPRLLFLLPFLSFVNRWNHWGDFDFPGFLRFGFSPGALMIYIILWLVIPEATTTSEKLEMKGEKVDMNSIKNSVMEEMKGVQDRATKLGNEARSMATEKGKAFASDIRTASRRSGGALGNIITLFFKIIGYFILGSIGLALVVALFALAIFSIGIFPFKDFVINNGWQDAFAWGTLVFFVAVPIIGIITWIIRKIARIKTGSMLMRATFIGLWILGWTCLMFLIASVRGEFRRENSLNLQEVVLSNPGVNKLEVTSKALNDEFRRRSIFRFDPFQAMDDDDSVMIKNVTVNIFRAANDSFKVTMFKTARGRTKDVANGNANAIKFNITQQDSTLKLDRGITINKADKFRDQHIVLNIYVPIGKKIRIDNSVTDWNNDVHFEGLGLDRTWDFESDNSIRGWHSGKDYIMKADGLYTVFGEKAGDENYDDRRNRRTKTTVTKDGVVVEENYTDDEDNDVNYRYDEKKPVVVPSVLDSIREKLNAEEKRTRDSLERTIEKSKKELEKLKIKTDGATAMNGHILQGYNPMLLMN